MKVSNVDEHRAAAKSNVIFKFKHSQLVFNLEAPQVTVET